VTVLGDVELGRRLGSGGYGVVHAGRLRSTNAHVAVKLLHVDINAQGTLRRLKRELWNGMGLAHPNVCTTVGYAVVAGRPAVVLELAERGALSALLHENEEQARQVPQWLLVRIVLELARGLEYLHAKDVMHRDMKPGNVVLDRNWHAKICDFGISTREKAHSTSDSAQHGSFRYMAPEVVHGRYKMSADIYSYSMLMYSTLHRKVPFASMTPIQAVLLIMTQQIEIRPEIELPNDLAPLAAIIEAGWRPDADERPTSEKICAQLEQTLVSHNMEHTPPANHDLGRSQWP